MKKSFVLICMMALFSLTSCFKETEAPELENNAEDTEISGNLSTPEKNDVTENDNVKTPEDSQGEITQEEFTGTIEEVMKKGGKLTCNISSIQTGTTMNGVIYMDGDKVRTEVSMDLNGMVLNTSSLMVDGYTYTWSDASQTGMKFKNPEENDDLEEGEDFPEEERPEDIMKFSCQKGTDSGSDFSLPSDITFEEFNEENMMSNFDEMEDMMGSGIDMMIEGFDEDLEKMIDMGE